MINLSIDKSICHYGSDKAPRTASLFSIQRFDCCRRVSGLRSDKRTLSRTNLKYYSSWPIGCSKDPVLPSSMPGREDEKGGVSSSISTSKAAFSAPDNSVIEAEIPASSPFQGERGRMKVMSDVIETEYRENSEDNGSGSKDDVEYASSGEHNAPKSKFRPFIAREDLRRKMLSFRKEFSVDNNTKRLVVRALSGDFVDATAELLTDAFSVSMGYVSVYRNFLKRQVKAYLRHHMDLPPKSVVIAAVLIEDYARDKDVQLSQVTWEDENCRGPNSNPRNVYADVTGLNALVQTDSKVLDNSKSKETNTISQFGDGMAISSSLEEDSSSKSTNTLSESLEEHLSEHRATCSSSHAADSTNSICTKENAEMNEIEESVSGNGAKGAQLVACLEISFMESTRSKYFTLNPPPDRPYICNMAVDTSYRRRGYGKMLLRAAEELIAVVGENCAYLHLRLKDTPASALYKSSGYEVIDTDSILVTLIGLDRRHLMKKEF